MAEKRPIPPMTWPESEEDRKFERGQSAGILLLIIAASFAFGVGIGQTWRSNVEKRKEPVDLAEIHADIDDIHVSLLKNRSLSRDNQYRIGLIEDEIESMKADIDGPWSERMAEKPESAADFPECE